MTVTANSVSITGERSFDIPESQFRLGGTRASGIYTSTLGTDGCVGPCGNAGNINISTSSLTLQSGGLIDSGTSNSGAGGNITALVNGQALMSGAMLDGTPGGIFSRTTGTNPDAGNGGAVLLKANSVLIENGAQLSASSLGPGAAGSVTIEGNASPTQSLLIDGAGSGVFTDTKSTGAGGNISINSSSVTLQNGGTISAATSGTAPSATGGTITVNAEHVELNSQAVITADTNGIAPAGTVDINTGSLAINSGGQIRSSSGAEQSLIAALTAAPTLTGGTITIDGRDREWQSGR